MTKDEAYEITKMIAENTASQINILAAEGEFEAKGILRLVIRMLETGLTGEEMEDDNEL